MIEVIIANNFNKYDMSFIEPQLPLFQSPEMEFPALAQGGAVSSAEENSPPNG
jgi:hypothetical protein